MAVEKFVFDKSKSVSIECVKKSCISSHIICDGAKMNYKNTAARLHNRHKHLHGEKPTIDLQTIRLSLSGALVGVALMGVFTHGDYEILGAVMGGVIVFFAKVKHFI